MNVILITLRAAVVYVGGWNPLRFKLDLSEWAIFFCYFITFFTLLSLDTSMLQILHLLSIEFKSR